MSPAPRSFPFGSPEMVLVFIAAVFLTEPVLRRELRLRTEPAVRTLTAGLVRLLAVSLRDTEVGVLRTLRARRTLRRRATESPAPAPASPSRFFLRGGLLGVSELGVRFRPDTEPAEASPVVEPWGESRYLDIVDNNISGEEKQ